MIIPDPPSRYHGSRLGACVSFPGDETNAVRSMTIQRDNLHERLVGALEQDDDTHLTVLLADARAADIADSFGLLPDAHRSRIIYALPSQTVAEVVVLLDEAVRGDVMEDLSTESKKNLVSELPPDDAVDVLAERPDEESEDILERMAPEKAERIKELRDYDEATAGGIMTTDVVAVSSSATVSDAVEQVRLASMDEDLNRIYIVEDDRKLIGSVRLRYLVTNPPATRLVDICERDTVTVEASEDQETVLQIIRKYDVLEAAVVDDQNKLLGRITHDDLLDVAEEEAEEDLLRMAGTDAAELETSSVFHAARIRLTWLMPCMVGMLGTATAMILFMPRFDKALFAALAAFVPMIGATGGNSGIQISTVIVRGFATGELHLAKFKPALLREGKIALAMAPVCGALAWCLASLMMPVIRDLDPAVSQLPNPGHIAFSVALAMPCAIMIAAGLGIALPFTFRRLGVDPAIASGPLVTTTNDVLSVSVYLTIAWLLAT